MSCACFLSASFRFVSSMHCCFESRSLCIFSSTTAGSRATRSPCLSPRCVACRYRCLVYAGEAGFLLLPVDDVSHELVDPRHPLDHVVRNAASSRAARSFFPAEWKVASSSSMPRVRRCNGWHTRAFLRVRLDVEPGVYVHHLKEMTGSPNSRTSRLPCGGPGDRFPGIFDADCMVIRSRRAHLKLEGMVKEGRVHRMDRPRFERNRGGYIDVDVDMDAGCHLAA